MTFYKSLSCRVGKFKALEVELYTLGKGHCGIEFSAQAGWSGDHTPAFHMCIGLVLVYFSFSFYDVRHKEDA